MNKKFAQYIIGFLLIGGILGFSIGPFKEIALSINPYVIALITLITLSLEIQNKPKILLPVALVYIITLVSEIIGVNTGLIYGNYEYSGRLGIMILETPLVIGFLWTTLLLGSINIFKLTKNPIVKSILAATLMTGLDIIIEPVAINLGFWSWQNVVPPLYNYISWFLISFIGSAILKNYNPKDSFSKNVFFLISGFFIILNLVT